MKETNFTYCHLSGQQIHGHSFLLSFPNKGVQTADRVGLEKNRCHEELWCEGVKAGREEVPTTPNVYRVPTKPQHIKDADQVKHVLTKPIKL